MPSRVRTHEKAIAFLPGTFARDFSFLHTLAVLFHLHLDCQSRPRDPGAGSRIRRKCGQAFAHRIIFILVVAGRESFEL